MGLGLLFYLLLGLGKPYNKAAPTVGELAEGLDTDQRQGLGFRV